MNHAYVDGSFAPPEQQGAGGAYGVVLLRPGQPLTALSGVLDTYDCNVTELRAVLAAVEYAPPEPLTVYTDNTAVLAALGRGGPFLEEARAIVQVASRRGIALRLERAERSRRHMQLAHQLANSARRGELLSLPGPHAQADLRLALWQSRVTVSLRRGHECTRVELGPPTSTPRSVEALLVALSLARPQETLLTIGASKLAAALWHSPRRALDPDLQARLRQMREQLAAQQTEVLFERQQG